MVKKYVITGGPCSGKTTTIDFLRKQDFFVFEEAARKILKIKFKGKHSKEINRNIFQKEIFKLQEKQFNKSRDKKIVFFDRGFGDTLAYYLFSELEIPFDLLELAKNKRYNKIFFLEPLNFYEKDNIRQERKAEQKKINRLIIGVYFKLGYEIIKVPFMNVKKRVEFIKKLL